MKKLLNTLYVLSSELYLKLEGKDVVILKEGAVMTKIPLLTLETIIVFSYRGATQALMSACVRNGVNISFFSSSGRFLFRCSGMENGNVLLRRAQYRLADNEIERLKYSKTFIIGKIYNSRWMLERVTRDHAEKVDCLGVKKVTAFLAENLRVLEKCTCVDEIRGIEGKCAQSYFSVFNELILQQKCDFEFLARSKRPPQDNVNAALSFAYSLLTSECLNALESVGLDGYVGYMHTERPGRCSLALDLMEELRSVFADRFVVTCVNQKVLQPKHFVKQESGAVLLSEQGRKVFLMAWQERKKDEITHPYLKEKLQWGLVPYVQALLLARTIRGDLTEYPPFFWK